MKTIVLTGGGTGGHVIPSLALLPELKKHFDTIVFIGAGGIEKRLSEEAGLPFYGVKTVKFDRSKPFSNVKIPFLLHKGIVESEEIFNRIKPDVVFSKGGYVALPACFAARKKNVPVVCHESDYTLGLANKITARFCAKMLTSFEDTPRGIFVGNPVRDEILSGSRRVAIKKYPIDGSKKTILICGGSQGAAAINETIYKALPELTKKYNVIHIAGKSGDYSVKKEGYYQLEYANDMPDLFALADLVISRAGANTLFEIAAIGKPALCIPLPKGNSRGDQVLNAEYFKKKGFIDILPQEDLFAESLLYKTERAFDMHPPKLDISKINEIIVKEIVSVV